MTDQIRTAIVTGAGSGVGKASALALLNDGWQVALAGRRAEPLAETASEAKGGKSLVVPTDVSDAGSVTDLFSKTVEAFGQVDMLFNNAGVNAPGIPLEELSDEQWQNVVNINLTGVFLCIREAFKVMKDQSPQGGRIINNGSISAHVPRPHSIAYTATKHAVTGMTRSAALDGRRYNIAVGQIDIGNAGTEMAFRMADGVPQADGSTRAEPLMDVNHVGQAVVQMANLPLESNVQFMTIMATKMPFIGRG
ncbi:MAG: SDR family oxidoreductase [Burkholderiaceae bacterium]